MLLWPPLTGTQLSPVAHRSWVLPSGHTPGNRHDRRAKQSEGLRCCVCLHIRRPQLTDHKIRGRKTQTNNNTPHPHPPDHTPKAAWVSPLTLAAWNVRSLLENPRSNRSERRTPLVAPELVRYKVDITALSETRFSEQCQLKEVGAGYNFFWSGRPKAERSDAGVAFAIQNIVGRLPCLPLGINDHLMSLRLPLRGD
ncbi:unnamed protein product [Schistocephalus solidus]|uniref:Endonuclease/exonuclease/phosphatase domain-containing protein n=1 Tax=Schistocephalus solidus TaxID=70667 RepID=A0A183TU01_SCHSO|nr:unnamed protein product [Schistocephalus solidus]